MGEFVLPHAIPWMIVSKLMSTVNHLRLRDQWESWDLLSWSGPLAHLGELVDNGISTD